MAQKKILIRSTSFKSQIPLFPRKCKVLIRAAFATRFSFCASLCFDSLPVSAVCSLSSKSRTKSLTWESFGSWHRVVQEYLGVYTLGFFCFVLALSSTARDLKQWLWGWSVCSSDLNGRDWNTILDSGGRSIRIPTSSKMSTFKASNLSVSHVEYAGLENQNPYLFLLYTMVDYTLEDQSTCSSFGVDSA